MLFIQILFWLQVIRKQLAKTQRDFIARITKKGRCGFGLHFINNSDTVTKPWFPSISVNWLLRLHMAARPGRPGTRFQVQIQMRGSAPGLPPEAPCIPRALIRTPEPIPKAKREGAGDGPHPRSCSAQELQAPYPGTRWKLEEGLPKET